MNKKKNLKDREKSFKERVLECLGNKKPSPWGKSIGLDTGALTRIFAHNKIPSAKHLIMISKSLGRSINWLLTGEEHPLDKISRENSYMTQCDPEEKHLVNKLVEIFRYDDEAHKDVIAHNINLFCGDKLWVRMGRPERRKKAAARPGMIERRVKVYVYKN